MTDLTPVMKKFILHWGEMGSSWGVNRTTAQIHALLYLSSSPLTAEEVCETLGVARSTVSTGLRELQSWGIVKVIHVLGDRRDHFEALNDIGEMFRAILDVRKRREVDPTLAMLRKGVAELDDESDIYMKDKLQELLDFFEIITTAYHQAEQMPTDTLLKIARLGDNLGKVLNTVAKR